MALGSTQPLTEMSTRNLPGFKGRPARKADNLTAICEPVVYKMWEPRRLTTLCASTACYRDSFTFFYLFKPFHQSPYPDGLSSSVCVHLRYFFTDLFEKPVSLCRYTD
jgi:hypothetical protein